MKNQNRIYKLLLGVALIAELVCFAPDVKAQSKDSIKVKEMEQILAQMEITVEAIPVCDRDTVDNYWIKTVQGKFYSKQFYNQFWAILNEYVQKIVVKENRRATFEDFIMWMADKWDYVNLRRRGAKSN